MSDLPPTLQRAVEIVESFRCPFVHLDACRPEIGEGEIIGVNLHLACYNGGKPIGAGRLYVSAHTTGLTCIDELVKDGIRRVCGRLVHETITFDAKSPHGPENEPDGKGEGQ